MCLGDEQILKSSRKYVFHNIFKFTTKHLKTLNLYHTNSNLSYVHFFLSYKISKVQNGIKVCIVEIDVKNTNSINNYQKKKKKSINNHRSEFLWKKLM